MTAYLATIGVLVMFIQFTEAFSSFQKGEIRDFQDGVAKAFIDAGQAVKSTAEEHTFATMKTMVGDLRNEMLTAVKEVARGTPSNGPPGQGRGIRYDQDGVHVDGQIIGQEAPCDRGKTGWGDICRCVFLEGCANVDPGLRAMATERIKHVYKAPRNSYTMDQQGNVLRTIRDPDGKETVERTFEDAGSVMRAGTESLSGGATYGYLIKPEFYGSVYRFAIENSVVEPFATQIPMGPALEMWWPALDQYQTPISGQSAAYAGVQVVRKGETTQRLYTDAKLSQIQFKITDLTGITALSRDLLMDNYIAADALIQEIFGMAFAWKKDYEFLRGTGVGAPQGIFSSLPLLTVTRKSASEILYEDISTMLSTLAPVCWSGAYWITNITTLPQLQSIKNLAGNYVYQPNSLIAQSMLPSIMSPGLQLNGAFFRAQGTLEGLPLFFTEKVPVLGNQGDLNLVHGKSYGIANREGLEIGLSEHFLFDTDQVIFRFKLRNDAKPLWRSYYQQADGANTKVSPFVQLV